MNKRLIQIFAFSVLFCSSSGAICSASMSEQFFRVDLPVEVTADKVTYDKDKKFYEASGKVVISQGELVLLSDRITMNMAEGFAVAEGNVAITDKDGNIFEAQNVDIDLNKELLTSVNARLYFKEDTINFEGATIRKTGVNTYDGKKMSFTTCDCDEEVRKDFNPPWSIHTSSAKVRVGGLFTGWNVVFKVKGVPVLYIPFIAAPVVKDRQTGFLAPSFGYSDLRGFQFGNSLFLNMSESSDFTFYYDSESKKGDGVGLEHRYIRTKDSYGDFYYYNYRERNLDRVRSYRDNPDNYNLGRPLSADPDRWELRYHHREKLWGGVIFKANLNVVSDEEYFLDIDSGPRNRSLEMLESSVSFRKAWDASLFTLEFRYFDDLLDDRDISTYQKLPVAKYTRSTRRLFDTPLFLTLYGGFDQFEKTEDGIEGQRLDLKPTVSLPLRPLSFLEVTPSFSPRATYYFTENHFINGEDAPNRSGRHIYEASVDVKSTFVKLWKSANGERRLFTIRPEARYDYRPSLKQEKHPVYDDVDNIEELNSVTYSLNLTYAGMLNVGEKTRRHEYLYFEVSQSYDVDEYRDDNILDRYREPSSDVVSKLVIKPTLNTKIRSTVVYEPYSNWVRTSRSDISYGDKDKNIISLTHKYVRDLEEYGESNLRLHVYKGFGLLNRTKYTFYYLDESLLIPVEHRNETIENMAGVFYKSQCWGATLTYTDKLDEEVTMFNISLKGVGDIGTGESLY